jgi:hypothetical protein
MKARFSGMYKNISLGRVILNFYIKATREKKTNKKIFLV